MGLIIILIGILIGFALGRSFGARPRVEVHTAGEPNLGGGIKDSDMRAYLDQIIKKVDEIKLAIKETQNLTNASQAEEEFKSSVEPTQDFGDII